jgi:hypothetical protein
MKPFNRDFAYPSTLDGLDIYINPKSSEALDDIGVAILREKFFNEKNGGGYDAVEVLTAKYGRTINWDVKEYPKDKSKGIPRWVWLAGAGALVLWYVMRDNKKKGLTGVLKGKTFDAGNLS